MLGDAFLRGWYSIHQYEPKPVMGFVPFIGSAKSVPTRATNTPTESLSTDVTLDLVDIPSGFTSTDYWVIFSTIGIILAFFAFVIISKRCLFNFFHATRSE